MFNWDYHCSMLFQKNSGLKNLPSYENYRQLKFLDYAYLDDGAVLCHTARQYSREFWF
jgi:hypothetical protein